MTARLYRMCSRKGLRPALVAEVGVYLPETSNILEFIREGVPAMLVEADPVTVEKIRAYFAPFRGVRIHPVAVWDENGRISLFRAGASTFASDLSASPALINDAYVPAEKDRFEVDAIRFSEIDDGDIDLLSIDIEGAEWYVLKHMRSRPLAIALETHSAQYHNPNLAQIEQWMQDNGYERWFMDHTDSVFARMDKLGFSRSERWLNQMKNTLAILRHRLKGIKRSIKYAIIGRPGKD
jgi:FkbM family methyltransferase